MRKELLHRLANTDARELHERLMRFADEATLAEIAQLKKIITKNIKHDEKIKLGEVIVPKQYFYKVQQSGIMRHAHDIIDVASKKHPISTLDILILAGIKPITPKLKIETGQLLTVAGFKKISVHRPGQTPTKLWEPIDKTIHDEYRAEYFFTLLKENATITDTKALDDLI